MARRLMAARGRGPLPVHVSILLGGAGLGLTLALPLADPHRRCPPLHEGLVYCSLQKVWLPAVLTVLAGLALGELLVGLVYVTIPRLRAHWRAGERPVRMTRLQERPPYDKDPFLLAASWGVKTGRAAGIREGGPPPASSESDADRGVGSDGREKV